MFKTLFFILAILLSISAFSETITLKSTNLVTISDEINGASVTKAMVDIQNLNSQDTNEPIYLVLSSPGGSIGAGIEFIRFARVSRRPIHTVTIFAASMAFQIVEALPGKRLMAEGGYLMSHRASVGGIGGQVPGELDTRLDFLKQMIDELDSALCKRVGITLKHYKELIHDEYYAYPTKAIKDHFADAKVDLSCDTSLKGTHTDRVQTMTGPITVEVSDCPLISYPVKIL
jgi:ATP-dependent protease ClpP protease subunit